MIAANTTDVAGPRPLRLMFGKPSDLNDAAGSVNR